MLVFLLTFKSEELEETHSGGSQNPAAERKVQGNYYCFYLFICLEMLPRMSHDMAGCRISAENSSASIKDQQNAPLAAHTLPAASLRCYQPSCHSQGKERSSFPFLCAVHTSETGRKVRLRCLETGTEQRHSLSVPTFAGLSWQFLSVCLAKELEDPSQPRLRGTRACHRAKEWKSTISI